MEEKYKKVIVNVFKRFRKKHDSGPKKGIPFGVHFVNVGLIAFQIALLLEKMNYFNKSDVETVFLAGLFHDMNKIMDRSMRKGAMKDNIKIVLKENLDWEVVDEKITILSEIIPLHSINNPLGSSLYISNKKKVMAKIIQFADTLDLLKSANFEYEKKIVSKLEFYLKEIRRLVPDFKYTEIIYHYISDFRGLLTNIIHEKIMHEFSFSIPIARFVDGVIYLSREKDYNPELLYENMIKNVSEQVFNEIFDIDYTISVKNKSVREGILNYTSDDAVDIIWQKFPENIEELKNCLKSYLKELYGDSKSKKYKPIYDEFERIFSQNKNVEEKKEELKILIENNKDLKKKVKTYKDELKKYLENRLVLYKLNSGNKRKIFNMDNYGKYKTTCSICGSEFDVSESMKSEMPDGLKPQLFTNNYIANKLADPKRQICSICKLQFIANKKNRYIYKNDKKKITRNMYFLIIPYNFYPDELLEALEKELDQIKDKNKGNVKNARKLDLEEVEFFKEFFGNSQKENEILNFKSMNMNSIIIYFKEYTNSKSENESILKAYSEALLIQEKFPFKILITNYPQLFDEDIRFIDDLKIQNFSSKLSYINEEKLKKLYKLNLEIPGIFCSGKGKMKKDHFYEIMTQDSLTAFSVFISRVFEEKMLRIGKNLLIIRKEIFGGEVMDELKYMAEFAQEKTKNLYKVSKHQVVKYFDILKEPLKKSDLKLENIEFLRNYLFSKLENLVSFTKKEELFEYADNFIKFVEKIGNGNFEIGKRKVLYNWKKYRDVFYGYVWESYFENQDKEDGNNGKN
ncbi:HD domain-containing protein [Marinitoga sp. 1155]|uniref:HD domain-containing protein n=1 Tax=Marinitoga sp. 1155 TaxID=1428448 RepID=UPI000640BC97|nr:HD domain-containing protein [Marinitoga sp. 1155]KLO24762.1 hypothetical protein X274_02000 [Marinitoga sp. 1155]